MSDERKKYPGEAKIDAARVRKVIEEIGSIFNAIARDEQGRSGWTEKGLVDIGMLAKDCQWRAITGLSDALNAWRDGILDLEYGPLEKNPRCPLCGAMEDGHG